MTETSEPVDQEVFYDYEHLRDGQKPMTGTYQLSDYPETVQQFMTQPVVVNDSVINIQS